MTAGVSIYATTPKQTHTIQTKQRLCKTWWIELVENKIVLVKNRLPFLGDKQVALIGGQTGCPYWGTNRLPLLGDKQVALFEGHTN